MQLIFVQLYFDHISFATMLYVTLLIYTIGQKKPCIFKIAVEIEECE